MSLKASVEDEALWRELHELLRHRHMVPGNDALDSVNRLLDKNERVKDMLGRLQLPRGRTSIGVESWALPRLVALLHESQITEKQPKFESGAVAIVRHRELEFLVDGRRRINNWKRNSTEGPHRVLVVAEMVQ